MQRHRSQGADPWPAGPVLPTPYLMEQSWSDAVILHWRIPASVAAPYMPSGVEPDVFDGSTWVGLIGFRMSETHLGAALPVPYLGTFTEVNVRLYSRAVDGSRGVVFLSLDAPRLPVVLAARAASIPYVWSRCRTTVTGGSAPVYGYDVERCHRQAGSSFAVRPDRSLQADDELSSELTVRHWMHTRFAGRTVLLPVSHRPWPLHPGELTHLDDRLLGAAGLDVTGLPESVLFSPGVQTLFGRPRIVPAP
ncbi:YqjF family protein [Kocuria himachalensis]